MLGGQQPLGEPESIAGQALGHRGEHRRGPRLHRIAPLVVLTPEQHERLGHVGLFLHDVGDGPAARDLPPLGFQRGQAGGQVARRLILPRQPPVEQLIPLGVVPFGLGLRSQPRSAGSRGQLQRLFRGQRPVVQPQVLDPDPVDLVGRFALANLAGHPGAGRALQYIHRHRHGLQFAIEIDPDSAPLRRAIVGEGHMLPAIGFERRVGHHLEGVGGPL